MYHISDLKKFNACPRLYYLSDKDGSSFNHFFKNDYSFEKLITDYFNIDKLFVGQINDKNETFLSALNDYEWFFNARLEDEYLRIKVPLLHKCNSQYNLYFILYKLNDRDLDIVSFRIITNILRKFNFNINDVYLLHLNPDYVFNSSVDVKELFVLKKLYKDIELIEYIDQDDYDYYSIVDEMNKGSLEKYEPIKNKNCHFHSTCPFYYECFKEEGIYPDNSILSLVSSENKNKMFDEGLIFLKDVDIERIEGNKVQYAQIMADKNGGLFVDKEALAHWLESFKSDNISFIDFEWDRYLIPKFNGMHPFEPVCFEYSLYKLENGELSHHTFIGKDDCRLSFIKSLINNLPKNGPIIAYNAYGAECIRLKEMGDSFPEYKDILDNIIKRFVDLAYPFTEGLVYDVRMKGNFSIKKLISIVSNLSYNDLTIEDGLEAVYLFRMLDTETIENEEKILSDLDEYCSLDSYSMILIYKWLLELTVL